MWRTASARCRSSSSTGMITETEGQDRASRAASAGSGSFVALAFIGLELYRNRLTAKAKSGAWFESRLGNSALPSRLLARRENRGAAGQPVGTPDPGLVEAP